MPCLGSVASRVHSNYQRRLQDTAIGGRATTIELTVRRFFCDNTSCARTTFVEQVAGLTRRYARHILPARVLALAVAFALGGRAGERLLDVLAMPVGRMSLIRAIRASPEPDRRTPRVLGIDDFALRRGHVYATILIDITTGRPVDVLPDRTKETVAAWLQAHPGVQIVCRDRSGTYAEAVREPVPDAIQVADRGTYGTTLAKQSKRLSSPTALTSPSPPSPRLVPIPTRTRRSSRMPPPRRSSALKPAWPSAPANGTPPSKTYCAAAFRAP